MLALNNLSGFGGGAERLPTLTQVDAVEDTAGKSVYTFSGRTLGNQATVVAITVADNSQTTDNFTSVTIGGVTASTVDVKDTDGGATWAIIAYAEVSGTGDIVVTMSGSVSDCGITVYSLEGYQSLTPFDTDTDFSSPLSRNLNIPSNGCALGVCTGDSEGTEVTWTGLTEDRDLAVGNCRHSTAFDNEMAQELRAITATHGNTPECFALASWR